MPETKKVKKPLPRIIRSPWAIGVAIFVLALGGTAFAANKVTTPPEGVIMPGVSIGPLAAGGRTTEEVAALLRDATSNYALVLSHKDGQTVVRVGGTERADISPVALYDIEATVRKAHEIGREKNFFAAALAKARAVTVGVSLPLRPTSLNREALKKTITAALEAKDVPAENAHLIVTVAQNGQYETSTQPERAGQRHDTESAHAAALDRIDDFSADPIRVAVRRDIPEIDEDEAARVADDVRVALESAPFTLTAKDKKWTVTKARLGEWLDAVPGDNGDARLGISIARVHDFLKEVGAPLAKAPKDAIFEMADGKVTKFEPSVDGEELDAEAAAAAITDRVFGSGSSSANESIALVMRAVKPAIDTASSNPYGISEVIGVGESNFKGSPANRRHNIDIGAKSVHGVIVPAGEEFSLLQVLGTIDGTTGYLQELVIKGDKTTPEYGGGLCQIGSTAFRAALASGLPITQRRNHSYRVSYYERDGDGNYIGPGKDATIYDPAPDFRFLNDTGTAMLVQAAIEGNKLSFIFWGKKDGRVAAQTDARVYNVVPPPEKKVIETTELPPGVEKCTEKPHPGSDAMFTYTVTYPNGEEKKTDFYSHYRPWQEVCLVGVDPNAVPPTGTTVDATVPPSADATGATGN